jgi:hypothetical protein
MKSQLRGGLTIKDDYGTDEARGMVEEVPRYLRATTESPFVAISLTVEGQDTPEAYVLHGEEMGEYQYVQRHRQMDDTHWSVRTEQTLQWFIEELLYDLGQTHHTIEVELLDLLVARRQMEALDEELRNASVEAVFGETDRVDYNRWLAFDGVSPVPPFVYELTTQPVYDREDAIKRGEASHSERLNS